MAPACNHARLQDLSDTTATVHRSPARGAWLAGLTSREVTAANGTMRCGHECNHFLHGNTVLQLENFTATKAKRCSFGLADQLAVPFKQPGQIINIFDISTPSANSHNQPLEASDLTTNRIDLDQAGSSRWRRPRSASSLQCAWSSTSVLTAMVDLHPMFIHVNVINSPFAINSDLLHRLRLLQPWEHLLSSFTSSRCPLSGVCLHQVSSRKSWHAPTVPLQACTQDNQEF